MAVNEGLQPVDQTSAVPLDPNVRVPDHVRAAASAAEAIHAQAYAPVVQEQPTIPPVVQEQTPPVLPVEQQPPAPPVATDSFTAPADAQALQENEWARRYNSMRGRFEASERARAGMETQMSDLGQELVRTQNMLSQLQAQPLPPAAGRQAPLGHDHNNLITEADRESYGDELIDLARRAARESLSPELEQLRDENKRLTQRVQSTGKRELFSTLDQRIPTWRQINNDVRFKGWLRLPNIYTGQLRGNMLKAAVDGANAPQVLQLFNDFLAEAQATGQMAPAAPTEQQPQPAPRDPALSLETLAAPGRARPASGDTQMPVEKPIYSRADIAKFYDEKRRGLWANRLAEAQAVENDLTLAQRENRIRG